MGKGGFDDGATNVASSAEDLNSGLSVDVRLRKD